MARLALIIAIFAHQSGTYTLEVAPPLIARWTNPITMQLYCGTQRPVHAFTVFDEQLQCRCSEGRRWYIDSDATLKPRMYLTRPGYAVHEREHIDDVRRRLEQYLAGLSQMSYDSKSDCTRAAEQEMSSFHTWMVKAMHASNDELH